jgi:hypothetical protein
VTDVFLAQVWFLGPINEHNWHGHRLLPNWARMELTHRLTARNVTEPLGVRRARLPSARPLQDHDAADAIMSLLKWCPSERMTAAVALGQLRLWKGRDDGQAEPPPKKRRAEADAASAPASDDGQVAPSVSVQEGSEADAASDPVASGPLFKSKDDELLHQLRRALWRAQPALQAAALRSSATSAGEAVAPPGALSAQSRC